jgi:capsular exopolysaccharide synthesis family protein
LGGSLLLGIGVAIAKEYLAEHLPETLSSEEEVKQYLNLPTLGLIPLADSMENGEAVTTLADPSSPVAECFRDVRTSLLFSAEREKLKSYVLCSTAPCEGKSAVSCNLGVSLAYGGARTLIIDSDFRRPMIHELFKLNNSSGLSSVLRGGKSFAEAIQATDLDRLHILTSGPNEENPAEILGSATMREVLREACQTYDRVIVDTPAIMVATDAVVLASMVDGVIQVISSAETKRQHAKRGKEHLEKVGANLIGIILNKVKPKKREAYKYVGDYSRYYSHYSRYSRQAKKKKGSE